MGSRFCAKTVTIALVGAERNVTSVTLFGTSGTRAALDVIAL